VRPSPVPAREREEWLSSAYFSVSKRDMSKEIQSIQDRRKRVVQQRRERERSQRIQSILDAAKKTFFSKGYIKATMDEIALEAEVSKPTVYTYFKTKDELFFSLMLPVVEDIGTHLAAMESELAENLYKSGGSLIRNLFERLLQIYEKDPVTFGIVQLFQQTGLVWELNTEIQSALNDKGRRNFETMRSILRSAIKQGLLRKANVYQLGDVIWGMFVGIVQLETIKSQHREGNTFLKPALRLAQRILVDGTAPTMGPEEVDNGGIQ
jgi:AcrR family transcriptional regulator